MASYLVCNGTLNINAGVPECSEWLVYEHNPASSLTASLSPDDPAVLTLVGSIIALLATAWVFRQLLNAIFNRG